MKSWQTGLRAALSGLYRYSGAMAAHERVARLAGQQFMTILLFHRVNDVTPQDDGLTVPTRMFRDICGLLARRFRVVPLGDVFRALRQGGPIPRRTVAITFDDSYRDNLDAARVLREHGLPATFFLPTGFIGTDRVYDWDRRGPRLPNLTWDDVHEMAAMGFEIGSHTVSHANLGLVPRERAWEEMVASKATLEARLGERVRWLAYPYGGPRNLRTEYIDLIGEAGYEGALSAYGGFVWPGADPRVLPREAVPYFRSVLHLEMHLSGCLHPLYALTGRNARLGRRPSPEVPEAPAERPGSLLCHK